MVVFASVQDKVSLNKQVFIGDISDCENEATPVCRWSTR